MFRLLGLKMNLTCSRLIQSYPLSGMAKTTASKVTYLKVRTRNSSGIFSSFVSYLFSAFSKVAWKIFYYVFCRKKSSSIVYWFQYLLLHQYKCILIFIVLKIARKIVSQCFQTKKKSSIFNINLLKKYRQLFILNSLKIAWNIILVRIFRKTNSSPLQVFSHKFSWLIINNC